MKRPSRTGPLVMAAVFLTVSTAAFFLHRVTGETGSEQEFAQPDREVPPRFLETRTKGPLEHAPGPPVRTPELPSVAADKDELWLYGERYLGWEGLAQVDLDEYTATELRGWLEQDRHLYNHGDVGYFDALDELGYLGDEE